ncbi:hypothetical protein IWX81_001207 [Salinibacterium sp. CAN_S4]|uniref:DUF6264 family protein n=1 Tax=Salinibacterium sp. CAN_S4 TaxID=2787727 RepID=UPI0018F038E5
MTDDRPRPKYGEYAPAGSIPIAPTPAEVALPAAPDQPVEPTRKRRTWDVALTTALMLVGVLDVVGSFARFGELAPILRDLFEQQGIGTFTSDQLAADMGTAINVARVVVLVVGVAGGLWRLRRNRIAFWVPLSAGVLAFVIVCVCLLVVVISDPAFADYAMQQSSP